MTGLVVLAQRVSVGRCEIGPRSCLAGEVRGNLTGSLVASLVQRPRLQLWSRVNPGPQGVIRKIAV